MRKLFFIPLIISFFQLMAGCTKQAAGPSPIPANDSLSKTYLALGDSYTIGESVAAQDRFPAQTVSMLLNNDGIRFSTPEFIAVTGWTTGNLLNSLNNAPPKRSTYDFVTLLVGVNNQYQGRSQAEYSREFANLLDKAIQYAGNRPSRVAVLSIPDWSVTQFAHGLDTALIRKQIDSFNVINKQISLVKAVHYIDITPSTRMALTDRSLLAGDGLHPSGKEYNKWAGLLARVIKSAL